MVNHDQLEVRFLNAEAAALDAEELRFEAPPAPDIAAQVDAHLEIAIGQHILRAQSLSALIDILMAEFWEVDAVIVDMRTEQRRVRVEAYVKETM